MHNCISLFRNCRNCLKVHFEFFPFIYHSYRILTHSICLFIFKSSFCEEVGFLQPFLVYLQFLPAIQIILELNCKSMILLNYYKQYYFLFQWKYLKGDLISIIRFLQLIYFELQFFVSRCLIFLILSKKSPR